MQDLPTHLDGKLHFLLEPDTPNQDENNTNQWLNFLARIIFSRDELRVRVLHALSVLSSVNQLREFIDISFVLTNA